MRRALPLHPGDVFRTPARPGAKWHKVLACRRNKSGTLYVTVRRSRAMRALGLPPTQRIPFYLIEAFGYEVKH
jgi:hypothetical protein